MEKTSRAQSDSLKNNWGTMFKGIGLPAAGALAAYIALHAASSRGLTKHQIVPFKGHRLPTLAFAACSVAAFALGHAFTGPYRSSIEPPPNPKNDDPPPDDFGQREEDESGEGGDNLSASRSRTPSPKSSPRENYLPEELRGEDFDDPNYLLGLGSLVDSESFQERPDILRTQILSRSSMPGTLHPPIASPNSEVNEHFNAKSENQISDENLHTDSSFGMSPPNSISRGMFLSQFVGAPNPSEAPPPPASDPETEESDYGNLSLPPPEEKKVPPPNTGVLAGVNVMASYVGAGREEEARDQKTIDALKAAAEKGHGWEGPERLDADQVKKVVKAIEAVDKEQEHNLGEEEGDARLLGIVSGLIGKDLLLLDKGKGPIKVPAPQENLVAPSSPGVYNEQIHGPGGINMRQMNYSAFMLQYASRFEEAYGKSVQGAHAEIIEGSLEELTLGHLQDLGVKPVSKERYVEFCQAHRKLLESGPQEEALKIARCLAWARFMPNVQELHNNSIKEHIRDFPKEITAENFHKVMKDMNVAVDSSPQEMRGGGENLQKIKLYGELSLCNYFEVNPQTLRNQETWVGPGGEKRTIYHLRHATPNAYHYLNKDDPYGAWLTWDLGWAAGTSDYYTKIDPAYTAFLDFAKEKGEGVLYACHQKISDTQEGKRCRKLIELEESGKHPNLLLLFQSVEFPGFMKEAKTFEELKETLRQSFEEEAWNRLPQQVQNDKKYKEELWQVFDEVKKLYYGNQEDIPQEQVKGLYPLDELGKGKYHPTHTQKMIMLFYHYQREHLKFFTCDDYQYKVTYVNSGCKDNFDRGFANNCTTDQVHEIALYGNKVPEDEGDQSLQRERLIATAASGMGVTLHGKGIGILPYRLAPALLVSKLLGEMELDEGKQEKMAQIGASGWKLTGCGLPLQPNQPATPLIACG